MRTEVVGTTGFEPATSRTPSVRATRLRHVPTASRFSVSPAFEEGQDSQELFAQVEQAFALRSRELVVAFTSGRLGHGSYFSAWLGAPVLFGEMAARAGDGEALFIEKALDFENRLYVFAAVHAMAARALHRLQSGEFRFPVTQNERLRSGQSADFADAEQILLGNRRCVLGRRSHLLDTFFRYRKPILGDVNPGTRSRKHRSN